MAILKPSPSIFAPAAKTVVVGGRISATGTVTKGTGFTVALDTNVFTITFQHTLRNILSVVATCEDVDFVPVISTAPAVSAGVGTVAIKLAEIDETQAFGDKAFDFVAILELV